MDFLVLSTNLRGAFRTVKGFNESIAGLNLFAPLFLCLNERPAMKMCHKMKVYRRSGNRPEIRLLGSWLDKIGFPIGSEICVTVLDNGNILIESSTNLKDLEKFFEVNKIAKEQFNPKKWIREHGGISTKDSKAIDLQDFKESGYRGRSSLFRKNGMPFDVLTQEAQAEGVIPPTMDAEEFGQMVKELL